ncbi:hypothetical protein GCM10011487_11810 [Steroidobacter agaridevorans]|uniref:Uncharacterized protein n=1 Tax=Steroidobacter agaridevorans TaxID=2695856 RepID=A0A829Y854_9GAMM|nr:MULTISPECIES: hypothetical protein [Steroidobacteraceae]GFE79181.1 hypothetical protein GCM10011487_11810 [Steroidobacter agaridevorans]
MTYVIHQNRVSLRSLKTADFASQETLCFSATVLRDGHPIAEARNDGHGGCTVLRPLKRNHAQLAEAEAFARTLPPVIVEHDEDPSGNLTIDVTLEFLVDHLASQMHADRKIRAAFKRQFANEVLYVRDDQLLYLKGVPLKTVTDRSALFAWLRANHKSDITILAELPLEEAFLLWKRYMLEDGRS